MQTETLVSMISDDGQAHMGWDGTPEDLLNVKEFIVGYLASKTRKNISVLLRVLPVLAYQVALQDGKVMVTINKLEEFEMIHTSLEFKVEQWPEKVELFEMGTGRIVEIFMEVFA